MSWQNTKADLVLHGNESSLASCSSTAEPVCQWVRDVTAVKVKPLDSMLLLWEQILKTFFEGVACHAEAL